MLMKNLAATLFLLSCFPAMGGTFTEITNNGNYLTYSRACGEKVSKNGTSLILTAIDNPLISGGYCQLKGTIAHFECFSIDNSFCNSGKPGVYIQILDGGNFEFYGFSEGPTTYFLNP